MPRFMTLAQADQVLDRGRIRPPSTMIDQKSPGYLLLGRL